MKVNYYEVLGVERSASEPEIRDHFRKLARENHPDRYHGSDKAGAERKFQTLTEAVNVLTNPARRRQHDIELTVPAKSSTDPQQVARAYLALGAKAWKENDLRTAIENFDMAVKHNPQDAKAQYYYALAASKVPALMRQAVQAIEAAVQREPMNAVYLKEAGMICKKAGLGARAERYLDEALRWDSSNVEIVAALAELRQGRGDAKEGGRGFSLFKKS